MRKTEHKIIEGLLKSLANFKFFKFSTISKIDVPKEQGVYIIYNPRNEVVHVGRTLRGSSGLKQRLNQHLLGQSSFTKQYLKGRGSKLKQGYKFKYLIIKNPRKRALLESLAIGVLCPKHLGLGN